EHTRDLDTGEMQSENWFMRFINLNSHRGDQVGMGFTRNREGLTEPFQISRGIFIPAGKYTFSEINVEFNASNQRNVAPGIQLNSGEFYNGDRDRVRVGLDWRPNEHFFLSWNYDYQKIELPSGN